VYVLRQNCRAAGWRWDTKNPASFQNIVLSSKNNQWTGKKKMAIDLDIDFELFLLEEDYLGI
jgi:hypothetical protein